MRTSLIVFLTSIASAVAPLAAAAPPPVVAPPVVVTGTRHEVASDASPVAVEVVDAAAIVASGARDAAEILETRLGAEVGRSFRGAGLQVEGLEARHVLILIDGARVAGRTGEQVDLSRIPAESIARIEFVRGASSAQYGSDALAGVVNIITKRAARPVEASASASYGLDRAADLHGALGARGELGDIELTAAWRRLEPYRLDASPGTTGSGRDDLSVTVHGGLAVSDAVRLASRVQLLIRRAEGVDAQRLPPTVDGDPRYKITDRVEHTHTLSALVRTDVALAAGHTLQTTLSGSWYASELAFDQRGSDREDRVESSEEGVAEANVGWRGLLGLDHVVSIGVDGEVDAVATERVDGGSASRGRVGAYVQDEWTLAEEPALVLVPAVRLDLDTQFGLAVTPRLAARLDATDALVLRADVGLGYRAPGFKELALRFENPSVGYAVVGNPALSPERSFSARLGAEWRVVPAVTLGALVFRHDVTDLILTVGLDASTYTYVNVASATSQGGELTFAWRPVEGLTLDLGYTFTDARDDESGAILEGRSRHRGAVGLSWRPPSVGFAFSARAALVGPRPVADPEVAGAHLDAPAYALVTARASMALPSTPLTIFVGLDNALDAGDATLNPLRPRLFYAGLEARL